MAVGDCYAGERGGCEFPFLFFEGSNEETTGQVTEGRGSMVICGETLLVEGGVIRCG